MFILSVLKSLIFPILYYIIYGSIIYGEFRIKKNDALFL